MRPKHYNRMKELVDRKKELISGISKVDKVIQQLKDRVPAQVEQAIRDYLSQLGKDQRERRAKIKHIENELLRMQEELNANTGA